ncbi:MAG: ABC transporter permease [Propionibacteriaceae bacterium]|jgi:branched-chain amino acid transport system permease protein|nr:ABC transporter permease [Propionibacteriaceae bacterium]
MIDTLIAGLLHGTIYALIAVGMSLIFGVSNVANFAHGSVFALGTMLGWLFGGALGWGFAPTLAAVVALTGLLGWVVDVLVVGPLAGAPPIAALLATLAVAMILDACSQLAFTPQTRAFPELLPTHNLQLGGVHFGTSSLALMAATGAAMAALWAFLRYGKAGRAIRATAQDIDAARQMGIAVARIRHLSFAIASALGGMAGVFMGLFNSSINPSSGAGAGLSAFVAATIGGLGSIPGAVAGGLVLGVVEAVGVYTFGGSSRDIIIFGALVAVLLLRPSGLMGAAAAVEGEPLTGTFLGGGQPVKPPWWGMLAALGLAALVPLLWGDVGAGIGTQVAAYAIAAVGLTLVAGGAGQIVLGLAGPIAIGAYASALLAVDLHLPFLAALPAGGLAAAVVSSLLTFPVWRLSGHYVAIATIGVGFITVALVRLAEPLTRGVNGLYGIPYPDLFGVRLVSTSQLYLLDLAVLAVAWLVVQRLTASHLGKAIRAIGSDATAARALGVDASAYKALAYAIAAFFAGLSGALLASQYTYIEPGQFDLSMSTLVLTIVVLGGLTSPLGAVVGSVILVGVPELLRSVFEGVPQVLDLLPQARVISYGLILILVIRFRPQGLLVRRASHIARADGPDASDATRRQRALAGASQAAAAHPSL